MNRRKLTPPLPPATEADPAEDGGIIQIEQIHPRMSPEDKLRALEEIMRVLRGEPAGELGCER